MNVVKMTQVLVFFLFFLACKTTSNSQMKGLASEQDSPSQDNAVIAPPYKASGTLEGDVKWDVRFNLPPCYHEGQAQGVWCTMEDYNKATEQSGIVEKLKSWINAPEVTEVQLVYFSFSNTAVKKLLCEAAASKNLKATVYIHSQNMETENVQELAACHPNVKVISRGTTFGAGYILHSKIFLAKTNTGRVYFTSSSANLSSFGTALHIENWLFFDAPANNRLAKENLCFFKALGQMPQTSNPDSDRTKFAQIFVGCRNQIADPARQDIVFYPVPHANISDNPGKTLQKLIRNAQTSVKVAIHRMTTSSVVSPLVQQAQQGRKVTVLFDDDTFRMSKCDGGSALDVAAHDVRSYFDLRDGSVEVKFVGTNGDLPHLHHNKFVVIDGKTLFQGAGNFTSTSLNTFGLGNIEHFYVIKAPEIVQAYDKAWDYLYGVATKPQDHEVGSHKDKALKELDGYLELDESGC
ncbi:MAG: phospholipase D-like domain-containing protein [Oligoflexales bacterium]